MDLNGKIENLHEATTRGIAIKHIEENFFAVSQYWGSINNALRRLYSVGAMSIGVNIADMNWAWNEAPLELQEKDIVNEIISFYRLLKKPFWWWVFPCGQSLSSKELLRSTGFRQISRMTCMEASLKEEERFLNPPSNITIRQVTNEDERCLWERTSFIGFGMPKRTQNQYHSFVSSFDLNTYSPQKLFIAYWKNIPAATSLLFINNNTAGLYYVATIPSQRKKGCALSLTERVMSEARQLKCSTITLQSTNMGLNIYKRAGFKEMCKADIYTCQVSDK